MVRSLRGRLQLWYGLVLTAAVVGFAVILYSRAQATIYEQIDANLIAAAEYLDAALRSLPLALLEGPSPVGRPPWDEKGPDMKGKGPPDIKGRPDMKGPPEGKGRPKGPPMFGLDGRPIRRQPERRLEDFGLPPAMNVTPNEPNRQYFGIWRADKTLVKADGGRDGVSPEPPDDPTENAVVVDRGDYREATRLGPSVSRILVGVDVRHERAELKAFAWRLSGIAIGVVGIGLFGGWLVSSRIVKPIANMSATAATISASNLSQRIDGSHVDTELAGLASVLNAAFDRLQSAFDRQSQFTADASHELRTPLAVIRSHADWALNKPRSTDEYRDSLAACRSAAERMTGLVDGLLTLARADAGFPGLRREPVNLGELAAREIDLVRPLAAEKRITLSANLATAETLGDPDALTRVIHNLLTNAVKYSQADGSVIVHTGKNGDGVKLEVADTGIGIADAERQNVFDRFYRVDKARSRDGGGVGLGLAICHEIIIAHGGVIQCRPNGDCGTVFEVILPSAA
jgi:two-component system, OmpR family, sensor kinase